MIRPAVQHVCCRDEFANLYSEYLIYLQVTNAVAILLRILGEIHYAEVYPNASGMGLTFPSGLRYALVP
jgi:hypothetical protein